MTLILSLTKKYDFVQLDEGVVQVNSLTLILYLTKAYDFVQLDEGEVQVQSAAGTAKVTEYDFTALNGVVHVIDSVL